MQMKTAISIPDRIFDAAEAVAKRLGMSRSALYTQAVEAYLESHREVGVRESLDRLYSEESSELDVVLNRLQMASLPEEEWE